MERGTGIEKLGFVNFGLRNALQNRETLELQELQGLSEILDEILLELQEERIKRTTASWN
jgi:hypothetical protein